MRRNPRRALALGLALAACPGAQAACCYFSALEKDVNQPGQKAFLTWEPSKNRESFTVQPRFEGDARDFGMVIPTPSQPSLDEMPRDFFKLLAVYTILLPMPKRIWPPLPIRVFKSARFSAPTAALGDAELDSVRERGVRVLEAGVVGSLDYKILEATNANGLYEWLDEHGYAYSGDQETLRHYISKGWNFTVMKIDTKQMKKGPDGRFLGEITPTRFQFESKELVYPLRITQLSVKDQTEAIFYVQAPEQMDLVGDWSWVHSYRPMWLNSGTVCISQKTMTPEQREELGERWQWVSSMQRKLPGYDTTKLEWAHRINAWDAEVLRKPEARWGQFGPMDLPEDAEVIGWDQFQAEADGTLDRIKEKFGRSSGAAQVRAQYEKQKGVVVRQEQQDGEVVFHWFPDREAPGEDVEKLGQLKGHLKDGMFVTKFRKTFKKSEMTRDLEIVPVDPAYATEYLRILPQSPP